MTEASTATTGEAATNGKPILQIQGVHAAYGLVRVLHGIDLEVREGEVVVVLGANGAGKTTTMRAICGMVDTSGSIRLDGQEIADPDEAGTRIADREPGDPVNIAFRRGDAVVEETIVTGAMPDDEKRPRIGVLISRSYDFPVEIENNVGDTVGGPSAGLLFSLGIVNLLQGDGEGGDLTGGRVIAGTGTIAPDGTVGSVGGVPLKVQAARRDGATVFLVPRDECADAQANLPEGLRLIPVTTLDGAVDALRALASGGDVPSC